MFDVRRKRNLFVLGALCASSSLPVGLTSTVHAQSLDVEVVSIATDQENNTTECTLRNLTNASLIAVVLLVEDADGAPVLTFLSDAWELPGTSVAPGELVSYKLPVAVPAKGTVKWLGGLTTEGFELGDPRAALTLLEKRQEVVDTYTAFLQHLAVSSSNDNPFDLLKRRFPTASHLIDRAKSRSASSASDRTDAAVGAIQMLLDEARQGTHRLSTVRLRVRGGDFGFSRQVARAPRRGEVSELLAELT